MEVIRNITEAVLTDDPQKAKEEKLDKMLAEKYERLTK